MAITKLKNDPFKRRNESGKSFETPTPIINYDYSDEPPGPTLGLSETDPLTWKSINYASGAE